MSPPNSPTGALVLDANIIVAVAAKETGFEIKATTELARYAALGYVWYAPSTVVTETLYVLCGKRATNQMNTAEYTIAIAIFQHLMANVLPPPQGDAALIPRAQAIGDGYACNRSADGLYIALAEQLSQTIPTLLLTFDKDLPKQAARNAPTVSVVLLTL